MRSITEDMETANEELQSANEELQSSNEEMQSLNEELETSKEELQSTNEELIIVNREMLEKQQQLNAARYYAESIVSTIRDPLVILDRGLYIKTANASFYKKFDAEEKDIEGKLFYEIQNNQWDDQLMRSLLERILPKHERLDDFEINLKFPSLGNRTLVLNARQIINEKNNEQLILLSIEDITVQAAAQNIIKENEKRLEKERNSMHDFFTQAPAVLAILKGPEHVFEFANPAYMELTGNRDLIGKTLNEALPELEGQGFIELLNTVYKTGETYKGEEMSVKVDKGNGKLEQFFLNFTYQAFTDVKGETAGILVFAYDVTEQVTSRKKVEASEKRFSNILSQSIMAIGILKGTDMVISFANDPLLATWGKGKNIIGKPLLEVLPEIEKQVFPYLLQKVYTSGIPYYGYETKVTLIRKGKKEQVYYNFVYQPYTEVDNSITGITILATEVTEQVLVKKQIEDSEKRYRQLSASLEVNVKQRTSALKKLNDELKQTNMQLEQFAHVVSHDLQEPLRKILTFSNRLQNNHKDQMSTDVQSYLYKIEAASIRMTMLIQGLLKYSSLLQNEKFFTQIDLNETLKNIINDYEILIDEKKAVIKSDELPTLEAIPLEMNQLFYNLMSNALKFSKEDISPVITITSRTLSKKEVKNYPEFNSAIAYVELIFKDNGIGFEQQYADKIYTILQRLHDKETFAGAGIGLALAKKIVENHKGVIFADAKENEGASFHVILPVKHSI